MKKLVLKRLVIVIASILIVVILAEAGVRKFLPQLTYSKAYHDTFTCFTDNPWIPFTLKSNSVCDMKSPWGEFDTVAHINSNGYRGKEFQIEKEPGVKRILMLGDSFAFGQGVSDTETYSSYAERYLHQKGVEKAEVINAGYADSFSPDSYYVYLKKYGLKLKPDVIVVSLFVYNDITDLEETVWDSVDSDFLPERIVSCCRYFGNGTLKNKELSIKYTIPILRESELFQLAFNTINTKLHLNLDPSFGIMKKDMYAGCVLSPECIQMFQAEKDRVIHVLQGMNTLAKENDSTLIVMLIPASYQVYPQMSEDYWNLVPLVKGNESFIQEHLKQIMNRESISQINLLPFFEKEKENAQLFFQYDDHFTPAGNKVAGETIGQYILDNRYLD